MPPVLATVSGGHERDRTGEDQTCDCDGGPERPFRLVWRRHPLVMVADEELGNQLVRHEEEVHDHVVGRTILLLGHPDAPIQVRPDPHFEIIEPRTEHHRKETNGPGVYRSRRRRVELTCTLSESK